MSAQLICKFCGGRHKATGENFPLILYSERKVKEEGVERIVRVIVGYVCRKCLDKKRRQDFIDKHDIKPSIGQRIGEAVRKKIFEITKKEEVDSEI